jgi:uncharacterized membrane protein YfcA
VTTPDAAPAPERPTARRILLLLVVGAIGGTFSGAFGVGGGIVMVPLMLWMLGFDQRRAAATSLAAIVLSSISGSITYLATGHVDVVAGLLVGAGGIFGSLIGARLLKVLPVVWLRWGFIALLVIIAVRMFLSFDVERGADFEFSVVTVIGLVVTGLFMGVAAGLFGVGGGVLIVPIFIALFGVSDLLAKGTSLLAMIPTSVSGSIANIRNHLLRPLDGVVIGAAAVVFSFGGAMLALLMSPMVSTILFGAFVAVTAIQLAVRAIRQQRAGR